MALKSLLLIFMAYNPIIVNKVHLITLRVIHHFKVFLSHTGIRYRFRRIQAGAAEAVTFASRFAPGVKSASDKNGEQKSLLGRSKRLRELIGNRCLDAAKMIANAGEEIVWDNNSKEPGCNIK